jgi:hypothetical protein
MFNRDARYYCEMLGHDFAIVENRVKRNGLPVSFSWHTPTSSQHPAFSTSANLPSSVVQGTRYGVSFHEIPNPVASLVKGYLGPTALSIGQADIADISADGIPDYIVRWGTLDERLLLVVSRGNGFFLQAALPSEAQDRGFLHIEGAPFRTGYATIEQTAKGPALQICGLLAQRPDW